MWAVACVYIPRFPLRVEQLRSPHLTGVPVALASDQQRIVWASSEAEGAGVAPSMPVRQAVAVCHNLTVLPHDSAAYRAAWDDILQRLYTVSPRIESAAEGLAYVDVRGLPALRHGPRAMLDALEGVLSPRWAAQLGMAANKFVAYVAARRAEPGSPRWVEPREAPSFLAFQPLEWLPVPPEMHRRWRLLGLKTMGQLARLPRGAVQAQFGREGGRAWALCRGEDDEPLRPHRWPEIVAERVSFPQPATTRDALIVACEQLVAAVWKRRERRERAVRQVRLRLVFEKGSSWEQTVTLKPATHDPRRLSFCLRSVLQRHSFPGAAEEMVLEVLAFSDFPGLQGNLFGAGGEARARLAEAVRELKARYGFSPVGRLVEVEPWSRLPERQLAWVEYEP